MAFESWKTYHPAAAQEGVDLFSLQFVPVWIRALA